MVLTIWSRCYDLIIITLLIVSLPPSFRWLSRRTPFWLSKFFHSLTIDLVIFDELGASKDNTPKFLGWVRIVSYVAMFVFAGMAVVTYILICIPSKADWVLYKGRYFIFATGISSMYCLMLEAVLFWRQICNAFSIVLENKLNILKEV